MKKLALLLACIAICAGLTVGATGCDPTTPPPAAGFFSLQPASGSLSTLPDDASCGAQVHASQWEPRPANAKRNQTLIDPAPWHAAVAQRPYDPSWHNWNQLLDRVDGQIPNPTPTTDEIFQWAACKWGLPDNVLRAAAYQESTWYQYLEKLSPPAAHAHICVLHYSCGDIVPAPGNADTATYCSWVAFLGGYDYQQDYAPGVCPETFSILGIKSWQAPAWGQMPGNMNGSFPFNRNSTAFAADYYGSFLRGCFEGWITWLHPAAGASMDDLWGCVGAWFSGDWHSAAADAYIADVQGFFNSHVWLGSGFPNDKPACLGSNPPTCGPDTL